MRHTEGSGRTDDNTRIIQLPQVLPADGRRQTAVSLCPQAQAET
ncbi:hypothetical protein [Bacteroides sp. Marseille-P3684]|nr:hypothetical protein [Bacteroides sp. Marseille-P3684]